MHIRPFAGVRGSAAEVDEVAELLSSEAVACGRPSVEAPVSKELGLADSDLRYNQRK